MTPLLAAALARERPAVDPVLPANISNTGVLDMNFGCEADEDRPWAQGTHMVVTTRRPETAPKYVH